MKQIKDPVYGYVDIDDFYIKLINTPEFQRLRNIVQTSYQALYPSALHNRFVHSIGVFHLGEKAFHCFKDNIQVFFSEYHAEDWKKLQQTFLSACLLHDIGHSPFSHTGESFYKDDFKAEIMGLLPNEKLEKDIQNGTGKPHEAMSAIVGLKLLRKLRISNMVTEDLFVRAIIGVRYNVEEKIIEDTIIGMLNGSLIDVDKLDYLIRDGYTTGFNTMALDVERLFAGYTIANYTDSSACVHKVAAYKRGSLSVIENVVFANDLERHWIQNHPAILYDSKLVDMAIANYDSFMKKKYNNVLSEKTVFTQRALSYEGYIGQNVPLSLLSDDDIVSFLKNEINVSKEVQELREQYFCREKRLRSLWKSEVEFHKLEEGCMGSNISRPFKATLKAISKMFFFINKAEMERAVKEEKAMNAARYSGDKILIEATKTSLPVQKAIIQVFEIFEQFSREKNLDYEFAFIFIEHHYESNYLKLQNSDIYIEFAPQRVVPLKEILTINAVSSDEDEKIGYYYIYSSKKNIEKMRKMKLDFGQEIMTYIAHSWKT